MKPGELYHCKIVGGGHGDGEYLAEIVSRQVGPSGKLEFADIGSHSVVSALFDPDVFYYCIAASFPDYTSILLRSTVESFEKSIVRKITPDELPLFIGWNCTKKYQELLQDLL